MERATFGAGCFWGVQEAFDEFPDVKTTVGYMGGDLEHPTYQAVCRGDTGHVEVCHVEFNPEKVSYDELVAKFWDVHDPTQVDRQGPDVGRQYRSVIFYHTPAQQEAARAAKEAMQPEFSRPIATGIEKAKPFWPAEEYHQKYFEKKR